MNLKEKVHAAFTALQNTKIDELKRTLEDLFESARNETKSTAGDKHETALAHLQIEQQKIRNQLNELNEQAALLERIDPLITNTTVRRGSLVETDRTFFYICGGLGKVNIDGCTVVAISEQAPIAAKLMGKQKGESITMNAIDYALLNVF